MIRVAMASFWHVHARDYARQVVEHPDTELAAVWDEDEERGRREAERLGVPFIPSLESLLADPAIQAVVVDAPTNMHRQVLLDVASAKKHIFTEKVVTADSASYDAVLAQVNAQGVAMTVSLPRLYHGYTITLDRLLQEKRLGTITQVRVRLSHNGASAGWLPERFFNAEQCQGGALIDLGAHPVYLTRHFLGLPVRVSAHFGYVTGRDVEDNAVVVMEHASGALGIVEAGFVTESSPFSIEIHGTQGSALYSDRDRTLWTRIATGNRSERPEWVQEAIDADLPTAYEQWVTHIQNGTRAEANLSAARDLTRLMEASYASWHQRQPMSL
jgi:predicted dehydrogenase